MFVEERVGYNEQQTVTARLNAVAPPAATPLPAAALPWLREFAARHFTCAICSALLSDPVVLKPSARAACRRCSATATAAAAEEAEEAPHALRTAAHDLYAALIAQSSVARDEAAVAAGGSSSSATKRFVHVNRAKYPSLGGATATEPVSPSPARAAQHQNVTAAGADATSTPPRLGADRFVDADSPPPAGFHGVSLNPNVHDAKTASSSKGSTPVRGASAPRETAAEQRPSAPPAPPALPDAPLSARALQQLALVQTEEKDARAKITVDESLFFTEVRKQHLSQVRAIRNSRPNCARQIKTRADNAYEAGQYQQAVELYTAALDANDGTSKNSVIHGNRSAAHYMLGRYDECIDDCLAVLRDEEKNTKICSRAVKAATTKGDLARAVQLFDAVSAELLTPDMHAERDRLRRGIETLKRAEASVGRTEGDEAWRMLIADFTETMLFRVKFAESLAAQGRFERAAETLSVVTGVSRTPDVAYALGFYLFCSGFESFEQAQLVLRDFSAHNERCRALLDVVVRTDEGKTSGNSNFSKRDFARSIDDYTRAIAAAQGNARVLRILYCNRAAGHKELGHYREGIEDCNKAIELDPKFAKAFARRARCLQLQHDYAAAVRDFRRAVELDPTDVEVQRELKLAEAAEAKESTMQRDYYYVLGIAKTAGDREIKAKYRELSLRWHPDKCVNLPDGERASAEQRFKTISEAYQTLSDPIKRREYDIKADRERLQSMHRATTFNFGGSGAGGYRTGTFEAAGGASRFGSSGSARNFW